MLGTWKNRAWRPCVCRKTCWMARLVCSFPLGDWFILCKGNTQRERERESWEFCLNGGRSINMRRDVSGVSAATGGSERSICHNVFGPSVRLIVSFRYCFAPPVECKKNVTSPAGWIQITYGDSWNLFFFSKGNCLGKKKRIISVYYYYSCGKTPSQNNSGVVEFNGVDWCIFLLCVACQKSW